MFTTVLVPTDGSSGAEVAIAHATELGQTYGAAIHALYVVDTGAEPAALETDQRETLREPSERRGREATIRITDRAEAHDLPAVREVREGTPHREILAYAAEQDIDLIAMGTHGRTGPDRARLGSTTERVLTRSDAPVLSVRLGEDSAGTDAVVGPYEEVVIPTDGSDAAERAAETTLDVAEKYDATVHAVYVLDATTYDLEDAPRSIVGLLKEGGRAATDAVADMARERDLSATTSVRRGIPTDELLAYADDVDAELIAMGTRGQTVGSGRLLGSTTARVVRRSTIPVLTVS
ncbi:universal stress protein [Halopiger aswanensis]|uniref:Nucleotide-binding universal stress UspA family protein n=1 Tax=Halopiger aswanensis TaxID=148449 RepID=A0A419W133_9EURY|nr:universal stress protein [Halopiger aswanensis]RKD88980.1 nucleotide-binding universal stress UspA family protein [Halopiger aswanensis]